MSVSETASASALEGLLSGVSAHSRRDPGESTDNLLEDGQFSKEQVQAKVARVRSLSLMADQIAFEVGF